MSAALALQPQQDVIWQPHPGKQTQIFTTSCQRVLVGGGKKSGKTACSLGLALRGVNDPRFRCVFLRRSIKGLAYAEDQARKLFRRVCPDVDHNKLKHLFTFPNPQNPKEPGAQVLFWFAKTQDDCDTLEGWGYQVLIVDEARQYPDPLLIDTLAAELYAENDPHTGRPWMTPQLFLLSNPGGAGGEWLRERFAIDKFPQGDQEIYDPQTSLYHLYIHLTVRDNPSMDAEQYIASLRKFPLWKQKQMIDGDWFQREGSAFQNITDEHFIDSFDPVGWEIYRSCDYGYATVTAVHWWAVHPDTRAVVCIDERHFSRTKSRDVATAILDLEEKRGYEVEFGVMGKDAWGEDATGLSPAATMMAEGIHWRKAVDDRQAGYRAVCDRLATDITLHDGSQVKALRFWRKRCPHLCRTLPVLPQKVGEDDIDKKECKQANAGKGIDHDYDSARYLLMSVPLLYQEPDEEEWTGGEPRYRGRSTGGGPRGF